MTDSPPRPDSQQGPIRGSTSGSRPPSGRKQLLLIVAIAALSLGGSYLLFRFAAQDGPWGTTNQGEFVDPPQDLTALDIRGSDGRPLPAGETWWLWVVTDGSCGTGCADTLHQLRQVHVLLHRDADRVRRALVVPAHAQVEAVAGDYPDLVRLTRAPDSLVEGVYIVDPIGNLVFRYPLTGSREAVLKDLKRLLKVSQIG